MAIPTKQFKVGKLDITHIDFPGRIPQVSSVTLNGLPLDFLIMGRIGSTLVGTYKYQPFKEFIHLDPNFERLAFEVFDEIANLASIRPDLAVGCADYFFNHTCGMYWNLIADGRKNQARTLLEKICLTVDKWEDSRKKRVHKGTPYYFLTFSYREMGDIDSAFASAFKAIQEDQKSSDPILGPGTYKKSPAYKYASIIDDKENYLYDVVIELRKMLQEYITEYNKHISSFSITNLDRKILQTGNSRLEQIGHFFVYTLESVKKYLSQMSTLPDNDFYRIKNARDIFNFCLIADKIIESKYEASFRRYVPKRDMYMRDGVILLFEDKRWIDPLTSNQKKDPGTHLSLDPALPKDPKALIERIILNPIPFTCNGKNVNNAMRSVLLAYGLRNIGAHRIEKQDIFVSKYRETIEWLLFSIFTVVSAL